GALGQAMSLALADAGAIVIIIARDTDKTSQLIEKIKAQGGKAEGFSADVLDKNALSTVAQQIIETHGQIDILINGAGGNRAEATTMPDQRTFFDLPEEALRWVFDLNLVGTILPSQVFGQHMADKQSGVIINLSSMASYQPLTRVVAYSAAKAAINNFTQWLATYMATIHSPSIRVNAIAPGFFLGEQNRFLLLNEDDTLTPRGQQIIDHTPMNRFGEPDDLIGTLLWLCSDASRFVTGIVVPVDGGFSAFSGV
ncbi:MAG: SDR family oxidoreductase, partial [Chloroflexota bacterium]